MKVQTATLQGSGRSNQDAIVVTRRAAAVLDGASSWLPQPIARDGGWYARQLGAHLARALDSTRPIPELVADAIASIRDEFNLVPGASPESTVTIARWSLESIEVYALCDSPAVILDRKGSAIQVCDERLNLVGEQERARYRDHLETGCGYGPDLDRLLADLQRIQHEAKNRQDGYWVAEAMPEAAFHGLCLSVARTSVDTVLLMSDGALDSVAEYKNPRDWTEALRNIQMHGIDAYLDAIHQTEAGDPNGQRWPRAKLHDDKTIVALTNNHRE